MKGTWGKRMTGNMRWVMWGIVLIVSFGGMVYEGVKLKTEITARRWSFKNLWVDFDRLEKRAALTTLNQWIPDFEWLEQYAQGQAEIREDQWYLFERYFEKLIEVFPGRPEGYALLAYARIAQGDEAMARPLLEKAVLRAPQVLNFRVNLITLLARNGQFQVAASWLLPVNARTQKATLSFLAASQALRPLWVSSDQPEKRMVNAVQQASSRMVQWRVMLAYQNGDIPSLLSSVESAVRQGYDPEGVLRVYAGLAALALGHGEEAGQFWASLPEDRRTQTGVRPFLESVHRFQTLNNRQRSLLQRSAAQALNAWHDRQIARFPWFLP